MYLLVFISQPDFSSNQCVGMFVVTGLLLEKLVILYLPVTKLQQGSKYKEFPCVSQIKISFFRACLVWESFILLIELSIKGTLDRHMGTCSWWPLSKEFWDISSKRNSETRQMYLFLEVVSPLKTEHSVFSIALHLWAGSLSLCVKAGMVRRANVELMSTVSIKSYTFR